MPPPFSVSVPMYICPSVHSIHTYQVKNGFHLISFEKISISDSYFIHRYIIIKYRSTLIEGRLHQLL